MSPFLIKALPAEHFEPYFSKTDAELAALGAQRMTVDEKPGFPCRVSLEDAEIGEEVILLPYLHHDVKSPYRASGPVFVRKNAREKMLAPNEIPPVLPGRLLSFRAYDQHGMMLGARVDEGLNLSLVLTQMFENQKIEYIHIHNARPGCYSCEARRADHFSKESN